MPDEGQLPEHRSATSIWEWAVAAVGAAIIASAIGYMAWYGVTHPQTPPALSIRQTSIAPSAEGYLVQVLVRNQGGSTAAAVHIGGELIENGSVVEESEAVLDYVPENSARGASLQFMREPSAFTLQLRVKGMAKP